MIFFFNYYIYNFAAAQSKSKKFQNQMDRSLVVWFKLAFSNITSEMYICKNIKDGWYGKQIH